MRFSGNSKYDEFWDGEIETMKTDEKTKVGNKIEDIIKKSGKSCNVKKLSDDKFLLELEKKLAEEITEYQNDKNPEELADILEVIYRIAKLRGISKEELENIRIKKSEERGGFEENLFLIDTTNSD